MINSKHIRLKSVTITVLLIALLAMFSCKKNKQEPSGYMPLKFSVEKLDFDTIMTETGSITKNFLVYNPTNRDVLINKIFLTNGYNSEFVVNVNGVSGKQFENVYLDSKDSIFIFVQTKLKENNVDTLLFHDDSLAFVCHETSSHVPLTAWGQDVIKHRGETIQNLTIEKGKPHVIIDSMVVEEGGTLTLKAGARLLIHHSSNLIIDGSLIIEGTVDEPAIITSDRLEEAYGLVPAQWGSIIFNSSSKNNSINYANIKNGVNGIIIYGKENQLVDISITNSTIGIFSANGIYAQNADITCHNTIISDVSNYALSLQGGKHSFTHTTIANYGAVGNRNGAPAISISDHLLRNKVPANLIEANFRNSVIIGSYANEIEFLSETKDKTFPVIFDYCLIKDQISAAEKQYYTNKITYEESKNLFVDKKNINFKLDTLSQAKDKGSLIYGNLIPLDILKHNRVEDSKPDVGADEYFYEEIVP